MSFTKMNPQTTEFEFNGPVGAFMTTLMLPVVVYGLYFICNAEFCLQWNDLNLDSFGLGLDQPLLTARSLWIVFGWFAFQVLLERTLPGKIVEGTQIRDGTKLKYKMNGFACMMVSLLTVITCHYVGVFNLACLYDEFLPMITAANILAFTISVYLYDRSFGKGRLTALGGNSGNAVYDFFMGRELNPRIGDFDLKIFCELRPGLIGWVVLNLGFMAKQAESEEGLGIGMILVNVFQFYYVFDALWNESAILTTMDITTDGFGHMLCFGDLVWVPFTYTVQGRFLVFTRVEMQTVCYVTIVACKLLGLYIFRSSNSQKDAFRSNPHSAKVQHLKYIDTKRGTRLIVSGWWGMSRHINYFGDWLMAWSWCLPCGISSPIPYFYVIYFAVLLVHRQIRDDHNCTFKYGKDWDRYCKIVPYRIIPYIY